MEDEARGLPTPPASGRPLPALLGLAAEAERSPNTETCPFFRAIDPTGDLVPPLEAPDPANRCVAVGAPTPQSVRQQELVCLTSGHANCPRYLRGALVARQARRSLPLPNASPPVLASALVLVLSAIASVGFLFARGGLALAIPSAAPSVIAVAPETPGPSATPASPSPSPTPPPSETPSPRSPTPSPSPPPPPTAAPSPTPPATPAPTPTPRPTSDRYAVLEPCPDAHDCWIYTVRAGDNFQSIVDWFGVPFDTVAAMNPQLGDLTTIRPGDRIRMPPPTR